MDNLEFFFSRNRALVILPILDVPANRRMLFYCIHLAQLCKRSTRPLILDIAPSSTIFQNHEILSRAGFRMLDTIPKDLSPYHLVGSFEPASPFMIKNINEGKSHYHYLDPNRFEADPFAASVTWLNLFMRPSLYFT